MILFIGALLGKALAEKEDFDSKKTLLNPEFFKLSNGDLSLVVKLKPVVFKQKACNVSSILAGRPLKLKRSKNGRF